MRGISLSRFLIDEQWQKHAIPSDLRLLVEVVARAIKAISINVGKGALAGVQRYVGELLAGKGGPRGKDFSMRWVASMVADVYRILDVVPTALHQRIAVFLGSKNEVGVATRYHAVE